MTADTYSDTLGVLLMGTGNDNNSWGNNANTEVFQVFEDAIANALTSSVTGGTLDLSATPPPAAASQAHYAALIFSGTLTSAQVVRLPNLTKWWWVQNNTSGAFSLSLVTYASSTQGAGAILTLGSLTAGSGYVNGTYANVPLTGGSGSGANANITVAGGVVTSVTLIRSGKGYLATDSLSASNSNLGGSGSGFAIALGTVGNAIPQNSGWQLVQCDGNGNILVSPFNSNQIQMPDGSASAPAYSSLNEINSGWYRNGPQDWRLSINGTDALQVTGSGASAPNEVNVLLSGAILNAPSVQQAGVQIIPPGTELPYAGLTAPTGFLLEYGQAVSRSTYANLLNALRATFTGDVTNGQNTITVIATNLTGLGVEGSTLEGTGITGLTVSSISWNGTDSTITMSGNASSGSGSPQTCYAYPFGNGDGSTTFDLPDRRDKVLAGRGNMGGTAAGLLNSVIATSELGAAGGAQNESIGQINLPNVDFSVSGSTAPTTIDILVTYGSGSGPGTEVLGVTIGSGSTAYNTQSSTPVQSVSGTAASGGSGTPLTTVQPTGITNFIIKT